MHPIILEVLEVIAQPARSSKGGRWSLKFLGQYDLGLSAWHCGDLVPLAGALKELRKSLLASKEAKELENRGFRIFPLHSMVPREEQELVFQEPEEGTTNAGAPSMLRFQIFGARARWCWPRTSRSLPSRCHTWAPRELLCAWEMWL